MVQEQRKIVHIDMDAFFASVEQLDDPSLQNKPIAVGGSSERGVVAAASYEARKYGVRSAMASRIAKKKCPDLVFVRPRFERYKEISSHIQNIFHQYTDLVEPLSLDEAFLDLTNPKIGRPSATLLAKEIRQKIKDELGLNASAGISYNKFLAKIASDVNKPNGQFVITPDEAELFLERLEIKRFFGIGKRTAEKMNKMGVFFGRDLKKIDQHDLIREFGKAGDFFYNIVRGIDNRPVVPNRERKSIGAERTFHHDLFTKEDVQEQIDKVIEIFCQRVGLKEAKGKTISVKVKYTNFHQITRSKTLENSFWNNKKEIETIVQSLLPFDEIQDKGCRLLGVSLSNLQNEILFEEEHNEPLQLKLNLPFSDSHEDPML